MPEYQLFWGDLHTHLEDIERGEEVLQYARQNIDFYAVLCYPFLWEEKKGLRIETVGQREEFLEPWSELQNLARSFHEPGRFVTFLGYEWHGNRTRYGDHNVIYFDESYPLDPAWTLEELYQNLRTRKGIAIPHHTAYLPGQRGKDWSVFDEELSPVMEIFSIHGSSEGCDTPRPLDSNTSMGPRTSGGSFQDALNRGYRIGVIASNDYAGLPGRWGIGRAGVWAEELTRKAIWDAIVSRRTYAVTGDRIVLDVRAEGKPMGSLISAGSSVDVEVFVTASCALDRIELIHNGIVEDTYCHSGKWEREAAESARFKFLFEAGWGPASDYGHSPRDWHWNCHLRLQAGKIVSIEKCFTLLGQRINSLDDTHCSFELLTAGRTLRNPFGMTQGLIFEVEGSPETRLHFEVEEQKFSVSLQELLSGAKLIPLLEESIQRTYRFFGLKREEVENPDTYYHNARKLKLHRAYPERAYRLKHTFRRVPVKRGRNYIYIRVSQRNNQFAWSSPIWIDAS